MTHFAIVDASGSLVSEASVIDADAIAEKGLTAYEVDGPQDGRPWDNAAKAWGQKPAPRPSRVQRARQAYADATTDTERIAALALMFGVKD